MEVTRPKFVVALTADFFDAAGRPQYAEMGLAVLDATPHVERIVLDGNRPEIGADQVGRANAILVLTPKVTVDTVRRADDLLAIGRFGVGHDSVDVEACTAADVAVFIAAGAVDRSVAEATITWMLALSHHVRTKDRLLREGRWQERSQNMGSELRERTLGIVGLGGIGRTTVELLRGFGMQTPLAFDPLVDPALAAKLGVRLVGLDELLRESDFVSLHCPLNSTTRGLLGARELGLMKPTAYLINTARGGIVDEGALYAALSERRIAGAAIDCFVGEPTIAAHPLATLDNVLLAPHNIAWTDELFRDIGRTACRGMVELSLGRRPHGLVNPQVLGQAEFLAKWRRVIGFEPTSGG